MSTQLSMFEPYVGAAAVGAHLNISPRQVLALTRAGRLPGHPIDPNCIRRDWRYKISEIDAAMQGEIRKPVCGVAGTKYNREGNPASRKAN